MKTNTAVENALRSEHALRVEPEVVIDWNMNRYVTATATNVPSDLDVGFDVEIFPIESIVEPLRPTKGINKARVGASTVSDDYFSADTEKSFARYYIADVDDVYKYWTSPYPSNSSGDLTGCAPRVVYSETVSVNKIVITLENSWASPETFSIETTTNGTTWNEVANQGNVPGNWKASGQITLYWSGFSWQNDTRTDASNDTPITTAIRGVRLTVTSLEGGYQVTDDNSETRSTYITNDNGFYQTHETNGSDSHFDLIEISARLEVDISSHVIGVDDNFELGEVSDLYPIGTVTSNDGSISLSNLYEEDGEWVTGLFDSDNTDSPYAKFVDANARVTVKYRFFSDDGVYLGAIPQSVMYTGVWNGQDDETVNIELADHSKFFNDTNVPAAMWEGLTVPQILWRVMDSIGFNNYRINRDANRVTEHIIPVFYTTGEETVWDVLNQLAQASQSAIFFDAEGVLNVKTRDFAFSSNDAPVMEFTSENSGTSLANIVSLNKESEFQPNHFTVTYQKTNWALENRGMPTMQKVWEPEGDLVLRATPLTRTLEQNDQYIRMDSKEVKIWPYAGLVNINSELIRYEGKEFIYYTGSNGQVSNVMIVKSQDEHNDRDKETPWQYRYKNHYTGALKIKERGVWNSEQRRHSVDAEGYSVRNIFNGTHNFDVNGLNHLKSNSKVRLSTPSKFDNYKDVLIATKGDTDDTPFFFYGIKFELRPGNRDNYAGLVIHNSGSNEDGYYIEFMPSKNLNAEKRKSRNELIVYSRVGGSDKRIGDEALAIGEGIEYDVDVSYAPVGNDHRIRVWVNGKQVFSKQISGGEKNNANGKFGIFARGRSGAEFEYLYAIRKAGREPADDFSFMDKIRGGYVGDLWFKEWVFETKKNSRRVKKKTNDPKHRVNERYMDDFGPYVHEVREFDVKFEPAPVLHSRLYITNDWSATALEYRATPFGAKFVIANTYRNNAVLNGEDTLSYAGTGASINQIVTVFGRALIIDESQEEIVKNDDHIRRRGKIESELSNPWIQSKEMAKDVGDWMNERFSYGNDNISVEVFGNNLVEVGDVVHVEFPRRYIDDDFFVVGIGTKFDTGITTMLKLRRRVV